MNKISDLVTQYYPLSEDARLVLETSINSMLSGVNSLRPAKEYEKNLAPVFIGKLLNRLEESGIEIKRISSPTGTFTYRTKPIGFGDLLETSSEFIMEETMEVVIEDIVQDYQSFNIMEIYSIQPITDEDVKQFYVHLRGTGLNTNKDGNT